MKSIVLIVLGLLVVEIAVWMGVAQFVSGWWIFFATIVAFVVGLNIIRSSLAGVMPQMQQMQQTQTMDASPQMTTAFAKAFAGILFALPGLVSDVLGLVMLIPAVQQRVQVLLMAVFAKRQQSMMQDMMNNMGGMGGNMGAGGFSPEMMQELMKNMGAAQQGPMAGQRRPTVIDGEARTVNPEVKRIQSANDD
jgi:UPF0716 protein FxsA